MCMQMSVILAHYSCYVTRETISVHQSVDNRVQKINALFNSAPVYKILVQRNNILISLANVIVNFKLNFT